MWLHGGSRTLLQAVAVVGMSVRQDGGTRPDGTRPERQSNGVRAHDKSRARKTHTRTQRTHRARFRKYALDRRTSPSIAADTQFANRFTTRATHATL